MAELSPFPWLLEVRMSGETGLRPIACCKTRGDAYFLANALIDQGHCARPVRRRACKPADVDYYQVTGLAESELDRKETFAKFPPG